MSATAGYRDLECSKRRHHLVVPGNAFAKLQRRPVVQTVDCVHGEIAEQAVLDHRPASALVFFCGLENEMHRAVEVQPAAGAGGGKRHRHVTVVAAGMHLAGCAGGIGKPCLLQDRKCIDVCADANHL
ncbi:hypothetical protein D3C87_1441250 [compost metagenome]